MGGGRLNLKTTQLIFNKQVTVEEEMEDDPFKNYSVNILPPASQISLKSGNLFKNYSVNILQDLFCHFFTFDFDLKTTQLIFYLKVRLKLLFLQYI